MRIEIDQSGKIEYTNKNTVLAFSNGIQKGILFRSKNKRKIQKVFVGANRPEIFVYKLFAILLYLLIKDDLGKIQSVVVDIEYTGKENLIKTFLKRILIKSNNKFETSSISFRQVGRKSRCHKMAIEVYRRRRKASKEISLGEVMKYVL